MKLKTRVVFQALIETTDEINNAMLSTASFVNSGLLLIAQRVCLRRKLLLVG